MNLIDAVSYVNKKTAKYVASHKTPGAGVAIVSGTNIYLLKGYGVNDLMSGCPMTIHREILLASVSKILAGTLLCILEQENTGKILDAKVDIITSDPYVTENMTVTDLLSHRSGIPEQYGTVSEALGLSRKFIINSLSLAPNDDFRSVFHYTDIPFTQGVVVGINKANLSVNQAYQKLFNIIGMNETSINFEPNKYKGYIEMPAINPNENMPNDKSIRCKGKWFPVFNEYVEQQFAAGGTYSTLNDMAKFLQFQLQQGMLPENERLINSRFYEGVFIRDNNLLYGYGIDIRYLNVAGELRKEFGHSGALENVRTIMLWIQSLNIGIFVNVNSSPNGFPEAITQAFYAKLNGATDTEANIVFNSINESVTDALANLICPVICCSKGFRNIDRKIIGKYYNNEWGPLIINENGYIKLAKLKAVALYRFSENGYRFVAKSISKVPYYGQIEYNNGTLTVVFFCETRIYCLVSKISKYN